jgi:hypothetical protein
MASKVLLFLVLVTCLTLSRSVPSPPQPSLPDSWSADISVIASASENWPYLNFVTFGTLYVIKNNYRGNYQLDQTNYIDITFGNGDSYNINAEYPNSNELVCAFSMGGDYSGPIFDFSQATYNNTFFINGTSQDQWSGVIPILPKEFQCFNVMLGWTLSLALSIESTPFWT